MVHWKIIPVCMLSLSLLVLVVVAKATSQTHHDTIIQPTPYHNNHKQQHQQQHNHYSHSSHQPILSGSLFPEPKVTASVDPISHKEACPRGCLDHGDGLFLAVTSVGNGFPRIQYTCSRPSHAQATHDCSDHSHTHSHKDAHDCTPQHHHHHLEPDHAHDPADPRPEETPLVAHHFHRSGSSHPVEEHGSRVHEKGQGHGQDHEDSIDCSDSTAYTDLHITACADYSRSHRGHGYESSILLPLGGFHHQPKHGQIDTKQPGKAFFSSPHEQASEEPDSESHTTTLTYSHDDHPHVRSIHLTDDTVVHSISLIGHHRHHPVPPKGPERDNLERMPSIKDDLTTPEPIVSIASPTRVSTYQDSVIDHDRYHQDHYFDQNAAVDDNRHKEDRIHPPAPTPEPVPAAATHSSSPGSGSNHHIQQNHGHHNHNHQRDEMKGYMSKETMISHQTVRHHEQQLKPHQKGEDQGFRTVVHRVTTLIIETETIVAHPPQSTQGPEDHHHSQQNGKEFHLGDHIMFDAGEEGDMIVSIASQEQADHHRPHQNVKKNDAKSGKTKDEL